MKNVVKFGLVGLAGYLIGYYEHQYKTMKVILKPYLGKKKTRKRLSNGPLLFLFRCSRNLQALLRER